MERNESIEAYLLGLSVPERARLAELLLSSLEGAGEDLASAEYDAAWRAETERRLAQVREGVVAALPASKVFAALRTPPVE